MHQAEDSVIWAYAREHGYVIVTKDGDFRQRSFLEGHPPKIIWLRLGNCSTKLIESTLRDRFIQIQQFLQDPDTSFPALS